MTDLAQSGQASAFAAMIDSAVTSTGKFRVMEGNFSNLTAYQQAGNAGMTTTNTPGRIGKFEKADFLIYGSITAASASRKGDGAATILRNMAVGQISPGGNCARVVASVAVDIKIVDANTGEEKFAKQITKTSKSDMTCTSNPTLNLATLLRDIANETAMGLVLTMYPMKVMGVLPDGTIVINYGEGALHPGMTVAVHDKGFEMEDPDTHAKRVMEGSVLGTAQIIEVMPNFSKARPLVAFTAPVGAVVREEVVLPQQQPKKKHAL